MAEPVHTALDAEPFYERTGQLLLTETATDVERARARIWMQRQQGIETEFLDADAVRELEPQIGTNINGALYCPNDGVADHYSTKLAFAKAGVSQGVEISTHCGVAEIEATSSRATAVLSREGERIEAARGIFVLTNSNVPRLLQPWLALPTWSECLQVLISEPMDAVPFSHLTGHLSRTVSLKMEGDDRVMVSGGWRGRWDPVVEEGFTIPDAIEGNMREAAHVYPDLEGVQVAVADASHQESLTLDSIPIIDRVGGLENLWYGTGWCGHGWAIAPVVAELLARWALEDERPSLLAPFALQRFSQGK